MADRKGTSAWSRNSKTTIAVVIVLALALIVWGIGYGFGPGLTEMAAPEPDEVPTTDQPVADFAADEDAPADNQAQDGAAAPEAEAGQGN